MSTLVIHLDISFGDAFKGSTQRRKLNFFSFFFIAVKFDVKENDADALLNLVQSTKTASFQFSVIGQSH